MMQCFMDITLDLLEVLAIFLGDLMICSDRFFSGGNRRHNQPRARNFDLSVEMRLKFHESVLGCKKTIQYSQNVLCSTCVGSGARSNSDIVSCGACRGSGILTTRQGFMHIQVACSTCSGTGKNNNSFLYYMAMV